MLHIAFDILHRVIDMTIVIIYVLKNMKFDEFN